MPELYFIIGPTAVGKTALAIAWARLRGAEVLSCDAYCVYRGMDIGTAKPTAAEQALVPHHGIDLSDADRPFSVADYEAEAARVVEDCTRRGRPLVVCGGSGFYLRSFFACATDDTAVSAELSARVRGIFASGGLPTLVEALHALNPGGVRDIDLQNPRRVQAALERCMASGLPLSELQRAFRSRPEPFAGYDKRICVLSRSSQDLEARIQARASAMVEEGLVEEVLRLRAKGFERNVSAATAIGYREVLAWLDSGQTSKEALVESIAASTRKLVKKQRSFFRNQLPALKIVELAPDGQVAVAGLFEDAPQARFDRSASC
jgi:tRNA dimethylallyltransferase